MGLELLGRLRNKPSSFRSAFLMVVRDCII